MVAQQQIDRQRLEALGPAERIVTTLTTFTDHLQHGRPGMVVADARFNTKVRWDPVTWKKENEVKKVYRLSKDGKKVVGTPIGVLRDDKKVVAENGNVIGEYRDPGLFPEVVAYLYRQVAEAYKLDQEFVARWASWQFQKEHRDLKVILAAFLLVQERAGDPVKENGEVIFLDSDYRAVGEAMCLIATGDNYFNPKLLLRVGDVLALDEVAAINRELGFGKSARTATMGRYDKAVAKWLLYREQNPRMLEGLVKAGFRTSVMALARRVGYKPSTPTFFALLRWKQKQAKDGRRQLSIGVEVTQAESWQGKTEAEICERIVETKPNWKRLVGLLPANLGLTQAIVAAAVETGCLSNADLLILTPTLEDLGLLKDGPILARWKAATEKAENQRAANIAKNVKTKEVRETLQDSADKAMVKAMAEVTKDLRVYVVVDKSGSMAQCIEQAKAYLTKFLAGFPLERTHVSIFNTWGSVIEIKAPKAAAVEHAFKGHMAGGGTSYAEGVRALLPFVPKADEDFIFIFVGDQEDTNTPGLIGALRQYGRTPVAIGLLEVRDGAALGMRYQGEIVEAAARHLEVPCFHIDTKMFDDTYAVTRTLRNLIASTPIRAEARKQPQMRVTLVEEIMRTPLLSKPQWAA